MIFFDEIQDFMDATTALIFFKLDGKYDVVCSGSALGVNASSISSVSVGFKDEYTMFPLDFEEFLWANGYDQNLIDYLLDCMIAKKPLEKIYYEKLRDLFRNFIVLEGFPKIVSVYFESGRNFSNILRLQRNIYNDYVDDISKYLSGIDIARAQRVFKSVPTQLAKGNHKFQFTKIGHGARFSEYYGVCDWLSNSGTILIANNCKPSLPLKGNEEIDNFRIYYADSGLLIASLDDESQIDLRRNQNLSVCNGAIYESIVASELKKEGYDLFFFRNSDSTMELDFLIRFENEIIPLEVKSKNGRTLSLNSLISKDLSNIHHGIKFADSNIGSTNNITTFPHFLAFLLKRFLDAIRK